jgi:hypothetical protein
LNAPPAVTRIEDAYPFPWRWQEEWTGTAIVAANNKRVVLITKGRASNRIDEERVLAEFIIRCVSTSAHLVLKEWWDEALLHDETTAS